MATAPDSPPVKMADSTVLNSSSPPTRMTTTRSRSATLTEHLMKGGKKIADKAPLVATAMQDRVVNT